MPETYGRSGITITWDPLPEIVASEFDTLGNDFSSFKTPLRKSVSKVMVPSIRKNFAVGGRPPWQPLVADTLRHKARKGYGSSVLIASGKLSRRATANDLWVVDDQEAMIPGLPSEIAYGFYHQEGWTPHHSGAGGEFIHVDPREWALIQREDANDIEEIFFEWIEERIARAGLG